MTRNPRVFVLVVAGAGLALYALWSTVQVLYAAPRAELTGELETMTGRVDAYREQLDDAPRVEAELGAFVNRTLGADLETVDHRLRTRLNRIAESIGLGRPTVGTGGATIKRSPARNAFPRSSSWKVMRDETDFVEVEAWVAGEGGLDDVIELVDRIDAEHWLKRIDDVLIDPKDNGERFGVTVRLTTLFLPGRAPEDTEPPVYDVARLDRYRGLVRTNPFRVPPPVVAAAPEPEPAAEPPPPPPAPAFPWNEWTVTGVAQGPDGPEVWLRRTTSGEARVLTAGRVFETIELVAAAGEWAEFREGDGQFRVRLGRTLENRMPSKDE